MVTSFNYFSATYACSFQYFTDAQVTVRPSSPSDPENLGKLSSLDVSGESNPTQLLPSVKRVKTVPLPGCSPSALIRDKVGDWLRG